MKIQSSLYNIQKGLDFIDKYLMRVKPICDELDILRVSYSSSSSSYSSSSIQSIVLDSLFSNLFRFLCKFETHRLPTHGYEGLIYHNRKKRKNSIDVQKRTIKKNIHSCQYQESNLNPVLNT